jgi:hypothetical protein
MRPIFTVHAGEYLVGEHIERAYPRLSVWVPCKDSGTDLLVFDPRNRKTASLQIKFSKDFNPIHSALDQSRLLAAGWWTHDLRKIERSGADFWVFVIPSFAEKRTSFIILQPAVLRRLTAIHGKSSKRIHSYLRVTKTQRCWEARGLAKADQELLALDRYDNADRDFTGFLNAWKQIESRLA